MSYSQAYHLDCEQAVEQYISDCCIPTEFGRVRSVAFIRKAYLQQLLSDPENSTKWQDGITNGDVILLELTTGSFDSGTPQKFKGYGRRLSTHGYRTMQLDFSIASDILNYSFFDDLNFRTDFVPAFRTSSWMHICDSPADIVTKEAVDEDLESSIVWSVECTIRSRKIPIKISFSSIASIFLCTTSSGVGGGGDGGGGGTTPDGVRIDNLGNFRVDNAGNNRSFA